MQGLEPLIHPFREGGGSHCCQVESSGKPQQEPKAGAGFWEGGVQGIGALPRRSRLPVLRLQVWGWGRRWELHGLSMAASCPELHLELLKNLTKQLDVFLVSKYVWHFSPFLVHQPSHLWKEKVFTSLPGWLMGLVRPWVPRAEILQQRQEQKTPRHSSLCTQHGNVPAVWQGSLLG